MILVESLLGDSAGFYLQISAKLIDFKAKMGPTMKSKMPIEKC